MKQCRRRLYAARPRAQESLPRKQLPQEGDEDRSPCCDTHNAEVNGFSCSSTPVKVMVTRVSRSSIRVKVGLKRRLRRLHAARPSAQESLPRKQLSRMRGGRQRRSTLVMLFEDARPRDSYNQRENRAICFLREGGFGLHSKFLSRVGWCSRRRRREESRPLAQFLSRDACGSSREL